MVSVASLLNPLPDNSSRHPSRISPPSVFSSQDSLYPYTTSSRVTLSMPSKKMKLAKDAAIFERGEIKGPNRFPPFEPESMGDELLNGQKRFCIYPLGQITEFPRYIPYNSEKKSFLEKTGREGFELFQYTYKVPGDDKEYVVMWDYNVGLVRMTPFFKSCKYTKTTPARMMKDNPGLKDICHSITGGALAAQGYWTPFHAARAVCVTFCYHIRHALIPLFGPEFVNDCLLPDDPLFGNFKIDPSIVRQCTSAASELRRLDGPATSHFVQSTGSFSGLSTPTTPVAKGPTIPKLQLFKHTPSAKKGLGSESGYFSEASWDELHQHSGSALKWTAVNHQHPGSPLKQMSSPIQPPIERKPEPVTPAEAARDAEMELALRDTDSASTISGSEQSRTAATKDSGSEDEVISLYDLDMEYYNSRSPSTKAAVEKLLRHKRKRDNDQDARTRKKIIVVPDTFTRKDYEAAHLLMTLHLHDKLFGRGL